MTYQPGDKLFDKYRIQAHIGRGAFADVYRVIHLGLNVQRALKVLRRDTQGLGSIAYRDSRLRFRLEAQLGAKLNTPTAHPNLLPVYNFEELEHVLVLEMEYAAGGNLADRLKQSKENGQPVPLDEAVRMAIDVAAGLAALHALDAVHRDLKPSNILFNAQGRAKVADLGLAQIHGGSSKRSQLSTTAAHPGTPGYMSPEQGSISTYLTPASDVYALGLVLFETLTGRVYHNKRPGTRASSLRSDVPGWLDESLARMLARVPEERPWDGEEVMELLEEGTQRTASERREAKDERRKKSEITRLRGEAEVALGNEKWVRVEQLIHEMSGIGSEGKAESARLIEQMAQARQEVEKLAREVEPERKRRELILTLAPGVDMEFVRVPAGEFLMGSDKTEDKQADKDELPQHKVHLNEYLIGKYPVTNTQFRAFVEMTGYIRPKHWEKGVIPKGKENHPVVFVSWDDTRAFCEWASEVTKRTLRLSTEAEWEKAARGPSTSSGLIRLYPWGDKAPDDNLCNFNQTVGETTRVGKYSPQGDSPYGCVDMAGNVWEWTSSLFKEYPYLNEDGREDPDVEGPRLLRGGSWYVNVRLVRSALRSWYYTTHKFKHFGFRCALSP